MDYYTEPPEKRVPCNVRLPESLMRSVQAIVRRWRQKASSEGHNPNPITVTFVVERLLDVGAEGVWAQLRSIIGHEGLPKNESTWKRLEGSPL